MPASSDKYDCDIKSLESLDDGTHVASIKSSIRGSTREYEITMPSNSTGFPDLTVTQEDGESELVLTRGGLENNEIVSILSRMKFPKEDGSYELWSTEEGYIADKIPSTIATPPKASLVHELRKYLPGPLVSDKQGQRKDRVAAIGQGVQEGQRKDASDSTRAGYANVNQEPEGGR